MGKEDLRHRAARTTHELMSNIQSGIDRARRERTIAHEGGHSLPPEVEEGGLVGGFYFEGEYPEGAGTELEIFRSQKGYNQSISTQEDERLEP